MKPETNELVEKLQDVALCLEHEDYLQQAELVRQAAARLLELEKDKAASTRKGE